MDLRAFMVSQAAILEAAVYEARFEAIQYPMLAPVVTLGGGWAPTVERRTLTGQGQAERIAHLADDWPNVDSEYKRLSINVGTYGASYSIARDDAWVAQQGGFNLATDKARLARRIVEEQLDELFRNGDDDLGINKFENTSGTGALTNFEVAQPINPTGTGVISAADAMAAVSKINGAIGEVYSATKGLHLPNTLALPRDRFAILAGLQVPNTTMTVMEWLKQNNTYTAQTGTPLTVIGTGALEGGRGDKTAVLYERDEDVLRFHMVNPITVTPPDDLNFGFVMKVGVYARSAGLEWRIPAAARRLTKI